MATTRTREEKIEDLRNAGENVAHNIGDDKLDERWTAKFGSTVDEDATVEDEEEFGDAVVTDAEAGSIPAVIRTSTPAAKKSSKVKVIIHSNDRENEEADMVVGLNGKLHRIKIGEEVEIDPSLIKVIKNALETRYVSVLDKKGQPTGEVIEKPRKRYLIESVVDTEDE